MALLAELGHPDQSDVGRRITAWNEDPTSEVTVVEDGSGDLVGLVAVSAQPSFHRAAPVAIVVSLVVSSQARGGGVGRALMDVVERFARSRGCTDIQLSSRRTRPDAHAFYGRLGFTDRCDTHAQYVRTVPYEVPTTSSGPPSTATDQR